MTNQDTAKPTGAARKPVKENDLPGAWDQGGKQGASKDGPKPSPQPDGEDIDPHRKGEERIDNKTKS